MTRASVVLSAIVVLLGAAPRAFGQTYDAERLAAIERRLEALETRTGARELPSTVDLDCETGDFSYIVPAGGYLVFMAACEGIEPVEDGYRVTVRVGNPHSASFAGLQAELGYGRDVLAAASQGVGFSSSQPVGPGWNVLTFTLNPQSAEGLTILRFTFSVNSVVMRVN